MFNMKKTETIDELFERFQTVAVSFKKHYSRVL